jgi:hypothetical protein
MKSRIWIGVIVAALVCPRGLNAEPCCRENCVAKPFGPAGGWHPYGGGLLNWWPRHCFPRCGAPDNYCRKPLPNVCWPPYPPYYIWGPR